jgi:uncharacterized membrane protein YfcA
VNEVLVMLIGLGAGAVAGLLGVGGGILFVPALAILLDHSQIEAESTSLLAIFPVALVGAWRQASYGNVRLSDGIWVGLLSIAGVAAGTVVANALSQRALEIGFSIVMLGVALQLARRALTPDGRDGGTIT